MLLDFAIKKKKKSSAIRLTIDQPQMDNLILRNEET